MKQKANQLKELGLFLGTNQGFELERQSNRVEGAVIIVRLLGKEDLVRKGNFEHPFTDVPEWATSYVGYLYQEGLTKGVSEGRYGSRSTLSAQQFVTMMLRVLGYDDSMGDFVWDELLVKAVNIKLLTESEKNFFWGENIYQG